MKINQEQNCNKFEKTTGPTYYCEVCGKRFVQSAQLKKHILQTSIKLMKK